MRMSHIMSHMMSQVTHDARVTHDIRLFVGDKLGLQEFFLG
jgi:hypothetical protein